MSVDEVVAANESRFAAVVGDSATSYWLRDALRSALDRDPVDAVNDAELLLTMLQMWADATIDAKMSLLASASSPIEPGTA